MKVKPWAVAVSGVAFFVLQGIWFKAFANPWTAGSRLTAAEVDFAKTHPSAGPYVVALLCDILFAFIVAKVIAGARETTMMGGLRVGLMLGLGIAFPAMVTEFAFEQRNLGFMLIAAGVNVIGGALVGVLLGAWSDQNKEIQKPSTG